LSGARLREDYVPIKSLIQELRVLEKLFDIISRTLSPAKTLSVAEEPSLKFEGPILVLYTWCTSRILSYTATTV
jgi:hypothetical protein